MDLIEATRGEQDAPSNGGKRSSFNFPPNPMLETITVEISGEDLLALTDSDPKKRDNRIQFIFERLSEDEVGSLLDGFCIGDRETYNDDPIVMGISFDDELSGTIDVAFTGSAYYGCKDMDRLNEHGETVTFTIDREGFTIEFSTTPPDVPERPMDEI